MKTFEAMSPLNYDFDFRLLLGSNVTCNEYSYDSVESDPITGENQACVI